MSNLGNETEEESENNEAREEIAGTDQNTSDNDSDGSFLESDEEGGVPMERR